MMHTIGSIAIQWLSGQRIDVEVDIQPGIPSFSVVGLWDAAVQESRERVRSALKNSGFSFPAKRITVNLAPADTRKSGPSFDLPIALGIVLWNEEIDGSRSMDGSYFLGELALDGRVREITGILPSILAAKSLGAKEIVIPEGNLEEAALIPDICVYGAKNLSDAVKFLKWEIQLARPAQKKKARTVSHSIDFSEIRSQERAKRALVIAAAGGHNILLEGPPWSGKTLLSGALEGILPSMTFEEKLEVSKIYSVAGLLSKKFPLIDRRPFRKIHHTASTISIVGGGSKSRPGEVSLAHRGVLFLDEFLEFDTSLIEMLRQPIEDGSITVTRVHASYTYPAKFILVGAMNPCPCGFLGDPEHGCTCGERDIERYRAKLSGPILDRIDLFVSVPRVKVKELEDAKAATSSGVWLAKVEEARSRAKLRFKTPEQTCNADMRLEDLAGLDIRPEAKELLGKAVERLFLSARAYHRLLRVARTIADLEGRHEIISEDIAEALSYRQK